MTGPAAARDEGRYGEVAFGGAVSEVSAVRARGRWRCEFGYIVLEETRDGYGDPLPYVGTKRFAELPFV